jgi:hypothetical protein
MTVVDAYGATMTGGRLADEYRRSLQKTGSDDLRPLMAARVTQETIDAGRSGPDDRRAARDRSAGPG